MMIDLVEVGQIDRRVPAGVNLDVALKVLQDTAATGASAGEPAMVAPGEKIGDERT